MIAEWVASTQGWPSALVFDLYTSQASFRPVDFIVQTNVTNRNNLLKMKDGANASFSLTTFRQWWN